MACTKSASFVQTMITHAITNAIENRKRAAVLRISIDPPVAYTDGSEGWMDDAGTVGSLAARVGLRPNEHGPMHDGDDGFVMVLGDLDTISSATLRAEEILASLKDSGSLDGDHERLIVAIGIGIFPEDGGEADSLLRRAALAREDIRAYGSSAAGMCLRRVRV